MKKLLKSTRGMTLMEILVALSLLMIIIVGTTPVMLQAYDGLYTAGEYTQDTYEAKSEIEEKLATRNSSNTYPGFIVNFDNLGEVVEVNGRRAVSSMKNSLETLFANSRVKVTVVSSKYVNDDYACVASCNYACDANGKVTTPHDANDGYHEVVIQTTNLDFGDDVKNAINEDTKRYLAASKCSLNNQSKIEDGGANNKIIDISFLIPDKKQNDAAVYTYKASALANLKKNGNDPVYSVNPDTGRITVYINGFDFTQSPIKIFVTYLDENNNKKTTETYLHVEVPTIMAVGETTDYHYYTSPGVVTDNSGNETFNVYGRTMNTSGATGTQAIPSGTVFKSANWITETTSDGALVGSVYSPSYYVLTGSNGAIYRTYSFVRSGTVAGRVNLDTTDSQFNGKNQAGMSDVMGITEKTFVLPDRAGTVIYPTVWGGDFSHIYGYSTYDTSTNYYDTTTWYTQSTRTSGIGQAGYYSNTARYGYYYNGWGMNFKYYTKNSKTISYILTEIPYALRVGGYMGAVDSYDVGQNRLWERPLKPKANQPSVMESQNQVAEFKSEFLQKHTHAWWYAAENFNMARSAIVEADKSAKHYEGKVDTIPTYWVSNVSNAQDRRGDNGFAQLRIKALTTYSTNLIHERLDGDGIDDDKDDADSDVQWVYNSTTNQSKVTITDAVFIPTIGDVFYVGTVAAYGFVQQVDNISTNDDGPDAESNENNGEDNTGSVSAYWIIGDDAGTQTTVHKYSCTDKSLDHKVIREKLMTKNPLTSGGIEANSSASHTFFVTRTGATVSSKLFSDVLFTMGFTSNREMVYSKIVYGLDKYDVAQEAYKYCEPLYFQSHYGDLLNDDTDNHCPNLYMNSDTDDYSEVSSITYNNISESSLNSKHNDYYNVWFPGEMYNLTKVATKDNVTVAVGYAVAGSSYTYLSSKNNGSTGLGSIYNDGVLSAIISNADSSFSNLLYYKDNTKFDDNSLSSGAYATNFTKYGTHARDSVQFTAVDIGVHEESDGTTAYYAYYADNKGRVFRSKVATRTSTGAPQKVNYISDVLYTSATVPKPGDTGYSTNVGYMEQLHCHEGAGVRPSCTFDWVFSKITTIKVVGNYLLVSGHPNQKEENAAVINQFGIPIVVGKIDETTGEINQWNIACLQTEKATKYNVEDMFISDGRVYVAGTCEALSATNPGFMAVLTLSQVEPNFRASNLLTEATSYPLVSVQVPDKLYAIAGQ